MTPKQFRPTPQYGLVRREPTQLFANDNVVIAPPGAALADLIGDTDLLSQAYTHLRAGDRVFLLHFADSTNERLIERAQLVIVRSNASGVDFKLVGKVEVMPEPAARARTAAVEEALQIVTRPHPGFKLVPETEEQNAGTGRARTYTFWRVEDGEKRTLETFDNQQAAEEFLDWTVRSNPDFVIVDSDDKEISPRFRDKRSADNWLAQEHQRRKEAA